ncbi:MAG TPA: prepilin-type N-terminal cleavage/methylation domain-containing protein [Bacteroidia bacterium]|jgi:type IV pilus assembly protein PilE|nr:prepilin-type N-terminal cleavage/methylation domain-containing protein [Bacteroidia bacterium]
MKTMKFKNRKVKGFTLAELMVVLCIIGILVLMMLPILMPLISKTKAMEAQLQLKHLMLLEKSYFFTHSKYTDNLSDLDFEQAKLVTQDGRANYKIEVVEASNKTFKALATSVTDFDQDGQFNVWEVDNTENLKEVTKD